MLLTTPYICPWCSEECRAKGFVVLLDADIIHDFLIKSMIKALSMIQVTTSSFFTPVQTTLTMHIELNQIFLIWMESVHTEWLWAIPLKPLPDVASTQIEECITL